MSAGALAKEARRIEVARGGGEVPLPAFAKRAVAPGRPMTYFLLEREGG